MLEKCYSDIVSALNAEEACTFCTGLDRCLINTYGWVNIVDIEASKEYNRPVFRWKKCYRKTNTEAQKQAENVLGAKFAERSFENFEIDGNNKNAYAECKKYAENLGRHTTQGLIITGPVGVGKTHLAAAILKTAFAKGIPGAMVSIPSLLAEIRKGIREGEGNGLAEKVATRFFVVMDDLGAEKTTEWVQEELYIIINSRYEKKLPTVITTNCSFKELVEKVGERVADRLREMCLPIVITGESARPKKRKLEEIGKLVLFPNSFPWATSENKDQGVLK